MFQVISEGKPSVLITINMCETEQEDAKDDGKAEMEGSAVGRLEFEGTRDGCFEGALDMEGIKVG